MTAALAAGCGLLVGVALLLSEIPWFRRLPLVDRLRPFHASARPRPRPRLLGAESFVDVLRPLAAETAARAARILGAREDAGTRLRRIHSPVTETAWRVRQIGWAAAALAVGAAVEVTTTAPPAVGLLLVLGSPLLAFLLLEQQLAGASAARQQRLFHELPVVVEQLAMLVSAGYSLGAALSRLATRGDGACAQDLRTVVARVRSGADEVDALREWAALARVEAVDRLVTVLAHRHDTTDLGRLLSDEARAVRADAQRRVVEVMERRSQQVWVPVTVAALVPGALFLAVPFVHALTLYAGG